MPEETREQMLQFADANRDGHIDYAEFLTVVGGNFFKFFSLNFSLFAHAFID